MTRSDDRRTAILDSLAEHVLAHGLSASSLRPLAQAAGISDRMLLYYFEDKAAVIAATIERVAQRLVLILQQNAAAEPLPLAELRARLLDILFDDTLNPYMRLWLDIASRAAWGDPFYRTVGEQIARGFLDWGAAQLESPTPEQRATDAASLLVGIEGMLMLKSVGLDDICAAAR